MPDWVKDLKTDDKYIRVMEHYNSKPIIEKEIYLQMHQEKFAALDLTVDLEQFNNEVIAAREKFEEWGVRKDNLTRKGLALTKTAKRYHHNYKSGPANWPLDVWNWTNPDKPAFDVDFDIVSKHAKHFKSVKHIIDLFEPHLGRTNITWWNSGDHFTKHFDVDIERPINYRLWMSNHTKDQHKLHMGERKKNSPMEQISNNMESGRVYLIDTSRYHQGEATIDNVFSLLITLKPSATEILKELIK